MTVKCGKGMLAHFLCGLVQVQGSWSDDCSCQTPRRTNTTNWGEDSEIWKQCQKTTETKRERTPSLRIHPTSVADENKEGTERRNAKRRITSKDSAQFNLRANHKGVLICRSRVQGHCSVYRPGSVVYTQTIVQLGHLSTLDGEWVLPFWVPRLLLNLTIKSCWGCNWFQAIALANSSPEILLTDRIVGQT